MRRNWALFGGVAAATAVAVPAAIISTHQFSSPQPTAGGTPMPLGWSAPNGYPPAPWQPYSKDSVWNTPIGKSPAKDPNSSSYMTAYSGKFPIQASFGYTQESNQYQHPIYFGQSTDPVYTVKCTASWSKCVGSQTVHIPSYAIPAGGSDGHMAVIDETSGTEFDFWQATKPSGKGGVFTVCSGSSGPITGSGLNMEATAAGYALWAGVIRAQEESAGTIDHALALVTPCTSNSSVYPSISRTSDTVCPRGGAPYGARLWLNMTDAQVLALGAPAYKVPIYLAAERYGFYLMDTNGNYPFGIQFEADEMYTTAKYVNAGCPKNGAPCTPLTAYFHSIGDPGWNGSRYQFSLSEVPASSYVWLIHP